ncbi:MAB_1171c family putative transporter [Streptomyces cacaoi]
MINVFYGTVTVAAGWRVVQAVRAPRDPALRAIAVCLLCTWGIYATAVPADFGTWAVLAGDSVPEHRVAKVVQYLLVALCGYAAMCFYLYAASTRSARRRAVVEGCVLAAVMAALVAVAWCAPEGALTASYAAADMTLVPVFAFYALIGAYLGYVMAATSWWTSRIARASSPPHAAGLWLACFGAGTLSVACAMHLAAMTTRALGYPAPWAPAAVVLIGAGTVTFVVGISYPAARIRAAAGRLWWRRLRAYRRLEPLWRLLTRAYPDLVFTPAGSARRGGGVHRRLHRRMIECRDGLVRISPHLDLPASVSALREVPPAVVAARLRKASALRAVEDNPDQPPLDLAASCGQGREDDLRQLLELADALREQAPRRSVPRSAPKASAAGSA